MKAGWQRNKLGDVCSFLNRGISPKYLDQGGICVVNQKCVRDHLVSYEQARRHDVSAKTVSAERFIQLGDVLVNSTGTGTLGRVAQVREEPAEPTTVDSHVTIIRPIPGKFFPDFFGYMLIVIEEAIKEAGEGCGGQTELARSVLTEQFLVSYPTVVAEQQRIVGILDEAFDGIATAKANAEQNLQNARALFESYLQSVFTQRGEGWVEKRLGEVYDVRDGTHDSPRYHATGFPLITSKNLKREGLSFDDVNMINEQDFVKINQRSAVHKGDVLFAMIGTIGNPTLVTVEPNFAIKNVALFKIPQGQSGAFLKHYLASGWVISKMMQEARGTTQKFVGLGYLRDFPINVPPLAKQLEVVESLDELSAETQCLESLYQRKLAALDELKKSLLHQAFAGKL